MVLTQLPSRLKASWNLSKVISLILSLAMRNAFLVWWRECLMRMLNWSIICMTQRTSSLWGQLPFLRYTYMDMGVTCRVKVLATTNIVGVLLLRRARLLMVQMLARYAYK